MECKQWLYLGHLSANSENAVAAVNEATKVGIQNPSARWKTLTFEFFLFALNCSSYYAMAVVELAEAVAREMPSRRWDRSNMNPLNPRKLLLTKLTAVKPMAKQKYFLVSWVVEPDEPTDPIELVEIEAVFSKAKQVIA